MHLPDFSHVNLLVAGDLMLDRYWSGAADRLSPEAPVPVVRVAGDDARPGGAGNVALNAAALGGQVRMLGCTGDDPEAEALAAALGAGGVACPFVQDSAMRTMVKLRVLSRHQQLIRLDFEDGVASGAAGRMGQVLAEELPAADAVVLSDYGKGTLADMPGLIARCQEAGRPVFIDPKPGKAGQADGGLARYAGATAITPNRSELEAVVGSCADEDELVTKAEALRRDLDLEAILVTRGESGMTLVRSGQDPAHVATRAREVFDVTGAGDTVIATLASALAAGEDWSHAVALANLAAGVVVGRLGTATVTPADLRQAHLAADDGHKVVDEQELEQRLTQARTYGERVVMTNGCFDVLHAGHVAYLTEAAGLGDRLVVAVNDDASVARLKGSDRPVTPLDQRMAVLAGLEAVDWVVPFAEDTPKRLIQRLAPDVLVKGGDYSKHAIAGADAVRAEGGEVVLLPFREGCSSTAILNAVRGYDPGEEED